MESFRIYVITWNVATRPPEENLLEILNLQRECTEDTLPDFYVVGLQEVKSQPQNFVMDALFNDPWTNAFKNALAPYNYVKVKTVRLVGIMLHVFCQRKHITHLREIYVEYTKTGLLGLWGNKGAVTLRLQIYGCSICFVNCHLAPHDHMVKERIDDYNAILQGQKFAVKETNTILFHDYVFWFGDLNFRLNNETGLPANKIINEIKTGNLSYLMYYDQLKQVMESGEAFSELIENAPTFRPTYKFNFHSKEYDAKRRPAWTDRILYRVNKDAYENVTLSVKQLSYRSYEQHSVSDHKPVTSEMIIKVFKDYTEKQVEIIPLGTWQTEKENKLIVKFPPDLVASVWDWIGIYPSNFTDLDEYIHYVYLPYNNNNNNGSNNNTNNTRGHCSSDKGSESATKFAEACPARDSCSSNDGVGSGPEKSYVVTFPDSSVRSVGSYRLLFITQNFDNILGISDVFPVIEPASKVLRSLDW